MRYFTLFAFFFPIFFLQAQTPEKLGLDTIIRIRCYSTLNTKEPLYLLNGHIVNKRRFQDLDISDIATLNVIKGAECGTIYGQKGLNGVIIITTKGKYRPVADYTLTPEEIPSNLFCLYEKLNFGEGRQVIYLKNGKEKRLHKLKKLRKERILHIKVYQTREKSDQLGYSGEVVVVDVRTRNR